MNLYDTADVDYSFVDCHIQKISPVCIQTCYLVQKNHQSNLHPGKALRTVTFVLIQGNRLHPGSSFLVPLSLSMH
jgi:hypothetical protein